MSVSSSENSSGLPPGGSSSNGDEFRAHHHRRIRRVGRLAWPLFILFAVVGLSWLYVRLMMCTGGFWIRTCWYSYGGPLFLLILIFGMLGFLLLELRAFGEGLEERDLVPRLAPSENRARRVIHHTRHGYRNLASDHQASVRNTFFVTVALWGCFAGFGLFYWGQPALAAILLGIVSAVLAYLVNRFWFQ